MKLRFTLLFLAAAISLQTKAQWVTDSVSMGAGYVNDVYYNLRDGNDVAKPGGNWDLGFQMTQFAEKGGKLNASVRANHIRRDVQVYSLHKVASTSFGKLTAADTMVTLADQIVNNDTSWGTGAFYNNRGSGAFDFGWGMYAGSPSHDVIGDSLYLVKSNGVFYQVWIQRYKSFPTNSPTIGYTFKYAKWDGTGEKTDSFKRDGIYVDRINGYYDLATGTKVDAEAPRKNWDIAFKRYQKNGQPGGQNPKKLQAYTGVLSNIRVEVAKITGVDPNTITKTNYKNYSLDDKTNIVGDDWKTFNMGTFKYDLDANTSFIVKPDTAYHKEEYYLLQFTRFDGAFPPNTGKVVFRKKLLESINTSVNGVTQEVSSNYSIFPNPAQNTMNIMVDNKTASGTATLLITDVTGKVMQRSAINLKKGVNAMSFNVSAYANGTYVVNIVKEGLKISDRVIVQH